MEKQEEEEEDVKEEQLQCEALSFFVEIFESPALFELAFKCLGYMTSLPLISQSFTKIIPWLSAFGFGAFFYNFYFKICFLPPLYALRLRILNLNGKPWDNIDMSLSDQTTFVIILMISDK